MESPAYSHWGEALQVSAFISMEIRRASKLNGTADWLTKCSNIVYYNY